MKMKMKMKKVISLLAMLSFIMIFLTSIILYIVPQGRVAYWADWTLWGLSKEQWGAIHINTGILFLVSLLFHIYFNWKPMLSYLKNKNRTLILFTVEFNIALLITILVSVGTYAEMPPFSTVLDLSDRFKDDAAKKYGEPPYGHAELSSLKTFSNKMGFDLKQAMIRLKSAGIHLKNEMQTLQQISSANDISPQQLYQLIKNENDQSAVPSLERKEMPENPIPGTGHQRLIDLCHQYNLNVKKIEREFKKLEIKVDQNMTLKEIGELNQRGAIDIYEIIRTISTPSKEEKED